MRRAIILAVTFALGASLGACGTSSGPQSNGLPFDVPDLVTTNDAMSTIVGPGDVLAVQVFNVSELTGSFQVLADGRIKYPLIGFVEVAGQQPEAIATTLEERLAEKYLQDPTVLVRVSESVSSQITVNGAVEEPGLYPTNPNATLLQAVALAGGTTDLANKKRVAVFRQVEGKRSVAVFNLQDIENGETEDPRVYGSDIVVVDGSEAMARYRELMRAAPLLNVFRFF